MGWGCAYFLCWHSQSAPQLCNVDSTTKITIIGFIYNDIKIIDRFYLEALSLLHNFTARIKNITVYLN